MNLHSFGLLLMATLLATTAEAEQTCRSDLEEYTPTSRFVMNDDGSTVTDDITKMMWMRCSLGQMWNGKACAGTAGTYSWHEANKAVERINETGYAGHNDWRLPLVPNLASIVERRCLNPRINTKVFPSTPLGPFWSSMEKMGAPEFAYIIDFGDKTAAPLFKESKAHVRLVRGEPWWKMPEMPQ